MFLPVAHTTGYSWKSSRYCEIIKFHGHEVSWLIDDIMDMFMDTWNREFQFMCNITEVNKCFVGILNSWIVFLTKYMELNIQRISMISQYWKSFRYVDHWHSTASSWRHSGMYDSCMLAWSGWASSLRVPGEADVQILSMPVSSCRGWQE